MGKNIFKSFLRLNIVISIFCIIAISVLIIVISNKFYRERVFSELVNTSELFIGNIQTECQNSNYMNSNSMNRINYLFDTHSNARLYVYDALGRRVMFRDHNYIDEADQIDIKFMNKIESGDFFTFNTNLLSPYKPQVCYAIRFIVQFKNSEDFQTYYLVAYGSIENIDNFSSTLFLFGVISVIIVSVIAALILWLNTRRYAKFFEEISIKTAKFASGDFSEKINVTAPSEMKVIASSLNEMGEFIKNNEDSSKNFIANVSHELRTPMTTIGGFVDGILDGTIPKSKQHQYLVLISQEIKRLKMVISSMLNLTRFESGTLKPNFRQVDLTGLVVKTVFMFEHKINDKNIEIKGLGAPKMLAVADYDLIQQVIYNLVENAIKFTNSNGVICFSFQKIEKYYYINIRNTGEGLHSDELPKIFERFYKVDASRSKDTTGLGLGLSISLKIVNLHNGQIMVKSVESEYTEFTIRIPTDLK